jgi:hypothetical protein
MGKIAFQWFRPLPVECFIMGGPWRQGREAAFGAKWWWADLEVPDWGWFWFERRMRETIF